MWVGPGQPVPQLGNSGNSGSIASMDLLTRQWGYLPIVGAVVYSCQGMSTRWWACILHLLGPLLLQDHLQVSLGLLSAQLPCVATRRHCTSLGGEEALRWHGRLMHSAPLFTPNKRGYPSAVAVTRELQAKSSTQHAQGMQHATTTSSLYTTALGASHTHCV